MTESTLRENKMRWLATLGIVGLIVTGAPVADAAEGVQVHIQAIYAEAGQKASEAPKKLVTRLKRAIPGYGGFKVLDTKQLVLMPGKPGTTTLPNKAEASFSYLGSSDGFLKLRLAIPPRLKTEVRVKDGGTFYQAGIEHDGGILILAIKPTTKVAAK